MASRFIARNAAPIISLALSEDIGSGDVTSSLIPRKSTSAAEIISREDGIIAGLPVIGEVYRKIAPGVTVKLCIKEGAPVKKGQRIALLSGSTRAILTGERTVLNIVSILSGIATITSKYVRAIATTGCKIYDTRKTIPGLRYLSKYAVTIGGGNNHRMGLYDMILVKDNHIAAKGITKSVESARSTYPNLPVMVETENWKQFLEALSSFPDYILLDNMNCSEMKKAVKEAAKLGRKRPMLEASGGITLESVLSVAKTGVDRISVGALTHSYKAMDLSMEITEQ